MTVDLLHNKIIKDTLTDSFRASVEEVLCPMLSGIFGESLLGIQMYEDFISLDFTKDKRWYYPLTVRLDTGIETVWISWDISRAQDFTDGVPYAFVGESLAFRIEDEVPDSFVKALVGRARYFEGGYVKLNVVCNAPKVTMLSGKYSQTFIDELNRQISDAICRASGVSGIENSTVEVDVVFTPETYMEHTSENVTYRRLLMSAKGCSARDFWVKWTRQNASVAFGMTANVTADDIIFEIGEDVPHKIREKEYRFLVYGKSEKYRVAMGRKNITEWRDLIKRAVKRGELIKDDIAAEINADAKEASDRLSEILARCGITPPAVSTPVVGNDNSINDELLSAFAGALGGNDDDDDAYTPEFNLPDSEGLTLDDISESEADDEPSDSAKEEETPDIIEEEEEEEAPADPYAEARLRLEEERRAIEEERRALEEARARIEEERRKSAEADRRARELAEAEAERLRREQTELLRENQRLAEERRIADETRLREEAARREQEQKLREQLELEARERAREKMLFAEAARAAREEQERKEREAYAKEQLRREEEERAYALRRAEQERLAEEENIRRERERIENEARKRAEASARKRAEIEELARAARARMEEEARAGANAKLGDSAMTSAAPEVPVPAPTYEAPAPVAEPAPAPTPVAEQAPVAAPVQPITLSPTPDYTYTSKIVRLLFRRTIASDITATIRELLATAIAHFEKEHVYIKVKASIPDSSTVVLNFVQIPEEEMDLLINIIKFLGNSDLGIYKIILE